MTSNIKVRQAGWFDGIIAIIIATGIAVFLDIPVLRQLLGIIFLTIIPGLSILFLLKLDKLALDERHHRARAERPAGISQRPSCPGYGHLTTSF